MQTTYERGRFYIGPNGFPRFAGSSSGVYLADTVRTQLSGATVIDDSLPQVSDAPTSSSDIEQAFISRNNEDINTVDHQIYAQYVLKASDLQNHELLRDRITHYFAIWHPLFPFLDGAYLIQCFDNATNMAHLHDTISAAGPYGGSFENASLRPAFEGLSNEEGIVMTAVFLAVFTLGALDNSDKRANFLDNPGSPNTPKVASPSHATMLAHLVVGAVQNAKANDLFAIQALLALQLYLYATRALRPAMHMSGILTKLACEAGLHRCPDRYKDTFTSSTDREIRKRVFYSLYTLDRILSAEFGIPIMLSDTDIDTCLPGDYERHDEGEATIIHPARTPVDEMKTHESSNGQVGSKRKRGDDDTPSSSKQSVPGITTIRPVVAAPGRAKKPVSPEQPDEATRVRLLAANSLIKMGRMTGRAMELFNKSLKHRSLDPQEGLRLRADLDEWWNDIGLDSEEDMAISDPRRRFTTFLTCLYHQQNINLNRPALSLSPDQTQHAYALQSTIASVRTILSLLSKNADSPDGCFWPGYVDMVFFGCLILVYGSNRDSQGKGFQLRLHNDLKRASKILEHFQQRWDNLRSFTKVVHAFIKRVDPAADASGTQTPSSQAMPFALQPDFHFDQQFNDLLAGDFHFDFSSFELNPELNWAYHVSMPGSPNL